MAKKLLKGLGYFAIGYFILFVVVMICNKLKPDQYLFDFIFWLGDIGFIDDLVIVIIYFGMLKGIIKLFRR